MTMQDNDPLVVGHITDAPAHQFTAARKLDELLEICRKQIPIDKIYAVVTAPSGEISLREVGVLALDFFPLPPPSFQAVPDPTPVPSRPQIAPKELPNIEMTFPEGRELGPTDTLFGKAKKLVGGGKR